MAATPGTRRIFRLRPLVLGAVLLGAVLTGWSLARPDAPERIGRIGLFTSLPILWSESESLSGLLHEPLAPHWARGELDKRGEVVPLDDLAGLPGAGGGRGLDFVVMAQPRPLSPAENVALDRWVRAGGRLLLLADPLLTADSAFAIGDRRRPEGVVLLSPILGRWGLRLEFDEGQAPGETLVEIDGTTIPVNLPGRLALLGKGRDCALIGRGLAARCRIGRGTAFVFTDAAVLETADGERLEARIAGLNWLLEQAMHSARP